MKTKNFFLAALCLFAATTIHAAVLTVDNNPDNNAQYSTFNAALAAAIAYDTLLIQPSATSYGQININKPLTVIGRGHNAAAGLASSFSSVIISSSNVTVEGLINSTGTSFQLNSNISQIVVRNCRITSLNLGASTSNLLFSGNVLTSASSGSTSPAFTVPATSSDILFLNNYFSSTSWGNLLSIQTESVVFSNNIFVKIASFTSDRLFQTNSTGGTYVDNIFFMNVTSLFNPSVCTACTFQSNLTYSPGGNLPLLPNSTLNNVAPTWDIGASTSPIFSYAHNYNMLSGAPSTGATDGGPVGVFGAGFNFQINGFPPDVPRVTSTSIVTPVVFANGQVEVEFEAEAGTN